MHGSNNTFSGFVILLPTSCTEEKALALEDKTNYLILAKVLTHHACIKCKAKCLRFMGGVEEKNSLQA